MVGERWSFALCGTRWTLTDIAVSLALGTLGCFPDPPRVATDEETATDGDAEDGRGDTAANDGDSGSDTDTIGDTDTGDSDIDSDTDSDTTDTDTATEVGPDVEEDTRSPVTCAQLSCDTLGRVCVPGAGGGDATCGGCLADFELQGGDCVPKTPPIGCSELACESLGRLCIAGSNGADATCGGCLATHVAAEDACVPKVMSPTEVSASTDRHSDVLVAWRAVEHAVSYRVFRCELADCAPSGSWVEVASTVDRSFEDAATAIAGLPAAPVASASSDRTDGVRVTWPAVSAPLAQRYAYRVVAVGLGNESAPSLEVTGHRAERPVTGYERQVEGGAWVAVAGGLATEWTDVDAPLAGVAFGTVSASQGDFATKVALSATAPSATPGKTRAYAVRTVTAYGPGPASANVTGRRVGGALSVQWERSAGTSSEAFSALAGATTLSFDDTTAPANGAVRWYQLVASGAGVQTRTSASVSGSTTPTAGAPSNVRATSDRVDAVLVEWGPVAGATGYHIYRNGTKLTPVGGTQQLSYTDTGATAPSASWAAPSSVAATTNDVDKVTLTWVAPTRPLGTAATYTVTALNGAGEGPASAGVSGRRAASALVGFDVSVQVTGGNQAWLTGFGSETTFTHVDAPKGTINGGAITVTQGDHRGWVRLGHSGASVSAASNVTYKVRGRLADASYTPDSGSAVGRRAVGVLTRQWRRSADATAASFASVAGGTTASFDDSGAPGDGSKRWYQVVASASGCDPKVVGPIEGWRLAFVAITGGSAHTCALTNDGQVWCWGDNSNGQVSINSTGSDLGPTRVLIEPNNPLKGIVQVRAGLGLEPSHTCARTTGGEVWCWGANTHGQLGIGSTSPITAPSKVLGVSNATSIAVGGAHSCAIVAGNVKCWGLGSNGQLGQGTDLDSLAAVDVLTGPNQRLVGATHVAAGYAHSCARLSNGQVWCWGSNTSGQLGSSAMGYFAARAGQLTTAAEVECGAFHSAARHTSGTVSTWGDGTIGQLGLGTFASSTTPGTPSIGNLAEVVLAAFSSCARTLSGQVLTFGTAADLGTGSATPSAVPIVVTTIDSATAIGGGFSHYCAIVGFESWCWGENGDRQLADGTSTSRSTPVRSLLP